MSVIHRDISGCPGYRVTSDGDILSNWKPGRGGCRDNNDWRRIKSFPNSKGYLSLGIYVNGKRLSCMVHQLVATAFLGPKPDGLEVRHLDGNQLNNRSDNLCYSTHADNESDKDKHGTKLLGDKHPRAILSSVDIDEIRRRASNGGWGIKTKLAKEFGVSNTTIHDVINNKTWKSNSSTSTLSNRSQ